MKPKHLLAIPLLSVLALTSCDKEDLVQPDFTSDATNLPADSLADFSTSSTSLITSIDPNRRNLLIEEGFEDPFSTTYKKGSNPSFDYYNYFRIFTQKSYGYTTPRTIVRNGSQAARFEMRRADSGVIRAEHAGKKAESDRHRWYGLSLYLPSQNWQTDSEWDIITQFNSQKDAGEVTLSPPISLVVVNGRMILKVNWATARLHTKADGEKKFDLGPVEKDKWLDFVYHINFSYKSDGILEVWKNGSKVVDYSGPNSYNDAVVPWFKSGIYKRKWSSATNRVLYVDEVRVGNGNATYSDVAPSGSSAASGSTPPPSTSASRLTNVGGGKFTDSQSRTWSADANASGGTASTKSISISNTNNDALYRSYRYASSGRPFSYDLPVSSGTYTVKLHFTEPYFKASNARVFNVDLEGQRKLTSYDIYREVGFGRAVVKTFTNVSVKDGELNINFSSVKNNAIISAIELIKQ